MRDTRHTEAAHPDALEALADALLLLARRRLHTGRQPDYLSFEDLLALDLTEEEARSVLAGQAHVARDEVGDRLTLYRQEIANRGRSP
jgi:hypothetical protein